MKEPEYREVMDYIIGKLEKNPIAVLATCGRDMRVTARSMSFVHDGITLWFQTGSSFIKAKQLEENPNTAVCLENIQIEGIAENRGHSSREENRWFCEAFEKRHPGSYIAYTHLKEELIYRIKPIQITVWRYSGDKTFRDYVNTGDKTVRREYYQPQ